MLSQRITFISDPTQEFPTNTNVKFKVRLPKPLQLEGDWEASLWSLSVPDDHLPNKTLFADTESVIVEFKFTMYRLSGFSNANKKYQSIALIPKTSTFRIRDVLNDTTPAQTGVEFWKHCLRQMEETVIEQLLEAQNADTVNPVAIPNAWKPTFKWDGEDLVLEAVSKDSVATSGASPTPYSWFAMSESLAFTFGFLQIEPLTKVKMLGDNASGYYPLYDEKGTKISDSILTADPALKGPTRAAQFTPDVDTSDPKTAGYKLENGKIYFSRAIEWRFRRLNESFDKLHNRKEVVMVYTDLVQSTTVGNGRFPLLRKLSVDRQGSGRVTVEPFHREWVPLQTNWIETVEIQLSTPRGALTHLSNGKTLITVGLQRRL